MLRTNISAFFIISAILISANVFAQKVANYAFGKYGTPQYEYFSFWTQAGKPTEVTYRHGKDYEEITAKYLGAGTYQGKKCFKVQLPGNPVLYVIPLGLKLNVANPAKSSNKVFIWEYEGPVNGMGTFCSECAEDEKEAIGLLNKYYLK